MIRFETQNIATIFVRGRPYAQTRAKHAQVGDKIVTYSNASKSLKKWKHDLIVEIRAAQRVVNMNELEGALCVDLVFFMPIKERRRWGQVCHTKPDKDNLEKAVLDVLGDAGVFAVGDSQVGVGQTAKVWCSPSEAGVSIAIKRVRVAQKEAPAQGGGDSAPDWLA